MFYYDSNTNKHDAILLLTVKPVILDTLVGNKIVYYSDVVGASPVGAAPTTP